MTAVVSFYDRHEPDPPSPATVEWDFELLDKGGCRVNPSGKGRYSFYKHVSP
jgi:hypothetical protein